MVAQSQTQNYNVDERPVKSFGTPLPGLAEIADRLLGPRGCLFTFHRAATSGVWETLPNRNFYLNLDFLDALLSYLRRRDWDVVTMEDAAQRIRTGRLARKFVNFSVDDCYRDTYEAVVPLFRRHGVPVTLFVTTGIPDQTLPLIFAGLEDALLTRDSVVLEDGARSLGTTAERRALYEQLAKQWDTPDGPTHYSHFCHLNGIDEHAMHVRHAISWDMLEELANDPLVEIGGHTVSHSRISSLSDDGALEEIEGCRRRLMARLGVPARHFAFPYGRAADCGPRDFEITTTAGFVSASTTRKGLVGPDARTDRLPRITLNGGHQSLTMIDAHLSGMTAVLARALGRV